jgi:methyl-accepting chemotaxis protein
MKPYVSSGILQEEIMLRRHFLAAAAGGSLAVTSGAATAAEEHFKLDALLLVEAYRAVVDMHLSGSLTALKAASRTAAARAGNWDAVKGVLAALADGIETEAAVWFAQADGSYDTVAEGPAKQSLSDRDYFPDLLAGRDVMGALVISKSTGHRSIIVATPVMDGAKMVAALGVSVRSRLLSDMVVARTEMPAELVLYALDSTGKAALHRDPEKMFQFPSDIGEPSLDKAVAEILAQDRGQVHYSFQGRSRIAVFARSSLTGWKFVLAHDAG